MMVLAHQQCSFTVCVVFARNKMGTFPWPLLYQYCRWRISLVFALGHTSRCYYVHTKYVVLSQLQNLTCSQSCDTSNCHSVNWSVHNSGVHISEVLQYVGFSGYQFPGPTISLTVHHMNSSFFSIKCMLALFIHCIDKEMCWSIYRQGSAVFPSSWPVHFAMAVLLGW